MKLKLLKYLDLLNSYQYNKHNLNISGPKLSFDRKGKSNSSYYFDGIDNYLYTKSDGFPTKERTVSIWYNILNADEQPTILGYGGSNNECGTSWFQGINTEKSKGFVVAGHCKINEIVKGYTEDQITSWHHLVVTNDINGKKIFLDGKLIASDKLFINNTINSNNTHFAIGVNVSSGGIAPFIDVNSYWTKGYLDDIAIYNRALTEQEIAALYTETPVAQVLPSYVSNNGLVGYWPFNGNANDESGNGNNGTVNGATLSTDRNGNANSAYSFDGYNNNIKINENKLLNLSSQFSISFWSKIIPKSDNSAHHIIVKGDNSSNEYSIVSVGNIMYLNKQNVKSILGSNFEQNKWNQVTIVWNYPNAKIYINGVNSSEINTDVQFIPSNTPLYFGTIDGYGGTYGQLDDIAIYNRALTEQEITALYTGTPQAGLASTKVFVDAPATVNQNETLELSISTEALNTSDNVIAFQTDFNYDTTRYTYVGNNVVGTLNSNGTVDVNTAKKGLIKLGYMSQTALSGAGSLVKLKFKANDKVGQGIFSLSNFLFNTTNITSLKSDTVNTLDVTPPTAKLTYSVNPARKGDSLLITLNFNEKMAVSPIPQINLTGQNTLANSNLTKVNDSTYTYWWVVEKGNGAVNVNLATGTDLAGNVIIATPTQNPSFTVLPTVFGDIDTNKLVQAYDAALALQYSVGLNPLPTMDPLPWSNWRLAVANVDTVGSLTANDASLILQHSIGKISSFPADAKKRGGEAPTADVTVKREGNQLVFRTTGTLYAFNGYFKDNFNAFGQPEIKDKNAMVATNINATTYNVGLASSTPFTVNEPFLIIPIVASTDIAGTIDIVANTQEKALTYSSAAVASINEAMTTTMNVYPNPTKDVVTVTNAQGKTLRIVDFEGRIVSTQAITNNTHEVSLKSIGSKGEYIFQLLGENDETITTQKVVMQ